METAVARLALAASVARGAPPKVRTLERLVRAARASFAEYGSVGGHGTGWVGAVELDEDTRRDIAERGFRRQAVLAARETPYYEGLFERLSHDAATFPLDRVAELPVTSKTALRSQPDAFVSRRSEPYLCALTTGTTGTPASVSYSRREIDTFSAMAAMHGLASDNITPADIVQVSISLRAALATTIALGTCARVGAACYLGGQLRPDATLELLAARRALPGRRERASILLTYASYLGELVEAARSSGYGPSDFGLRSIRVGGEVVSQGLLSRAREVFGRVEFVQGYASTELDPLNASECDQGHLHFQPSSGLVEVLELNDDRPAAPGEPGRVVATPFDRETTILLRYDTQDVAMALPDDLSCTLRDLPGISKPLGRLPLSVEHDDGWTFQRAVVEALESVDAVRLPARFGFSRCDGGVAIEAFTRSLDSAVRNQVAAALEERNVPVRQLRLVDDPGQLERPLPLRGDLRDTSFEQSRA